MENYVYQVHGGNEGDCLEQLEFSCENNFNRSNFTSCEVERVLMEADESILTTMDQIGCQDANSFLNPMNDILGDISELNKNYCEPNDIAICSQLSQQVIPTALNTVNCSWTLLDPPSFIGVPVSNNEDNITDSGFFNISSGSNSHLLLPGNTIEYPNADCSLLGGDYASFNHLFQNYEQQQFSFMSTPVTSIQHPPPISNSFSDVFLNTIGTLPSSTTITPIAVEECQIGQRTYSPVKQELIIETLYSDKVIHGNQSDSENFAPLPEVASQMMPIHNGLPQIYEESNRSQNCVVKRKSPYPSDSLYQTSSVPSQQHKVIAVLNQNHPLPIYGSVPNQNLCFVSQRTQSPPTMKTSTTTTKHLPVLPANRFNLTAVFPRNQFANPPEMMIMHPLRTRKIIAPRKSVSTKTFNLSEYFDTSSINIPVIRERPRTEGKNENRRKQKLNIIPGAENLIFEIQRSEQNSAITASVANENWSLGRDLYPETELPELEEIFKRKKKTTVSTSGTKRSNIRQTTVSGVAKKKQCVTSLIRPTNQPPIIKESSTSYDEKISLSIALRQGRSKVSLNRIASSSDSDSVVSEKGMAQAAKSLKCPKCMKLLKTTKSLSIHIKRCTATPRELLSVNEFDSSNSSVTNVPRNLSKLNKNEDNAKSSDDHTTDNEIRENSKRIKLTDSVHEVKARPMTRSQTRTVAKQTQ